MAELVRYPNGVGEEVFYQKRAPASRPDWIEVVSLKFPSGRSAGEVVPRMRRRSRANLACLELHPHLVRAEGLDHPDELRVDLDPVPGVEWTQVRDVAVVSSGLVPPGGYPRWWVSSPPNARSIMAFLNRRTAASSSSGASGPWRTN